MLRCKTEEQLLVIYSNNRIDIRGLLNLRKLCMSMIIEPYDEPDGHQAPDINDRQTNDAMHQRAFQTSSLFSVYSITYRQVVFTVISTSLNEANLYFYFINFKGQNIPLYILFYDF